MPTIPPAFQQKKAKILAELARPAEEYTDLSPKGSVDVEIRELVDDINAREGLVTTSSCAGRISVFLEGRKAVSQPDENGDGRGRTTVASAGGKGGGGSWLFVSHERLEPTRHWKDVFGFGDRAEDGKTMGWISGKDVTHKRLVHFKFEPMVSIAEGRTIVLADSSCFADTAHSDSVAGPRTTSLASRNGSRLPGERRIKSHRHGAATCHACCRCQNQWVGFSIHDWSRD
jgi:tRNA(Phe) wybutosine-synthesizing methylase Tyw3